MTSTADLANMLTICEARYAQCQQEFAKLVAEENRLRAELNRLADMDGPITDPNVQITEMRMIGADVIWRGWLGRAKTAMNMKLAQVLAVKEYHLKEVRHAYGKVLVVEEMQANLADTTRKKAANNALSEAILMSLPK